MGSASATIPGAQHPVAGQPAATLVEGAAPGARVVLFDADGTLDRLTEDWPRGPRSEILRGGFQGWSREVLTPRSAQDAVSGELAAVQRQHGIANFFSGAAPAPVQQLAPPPAGLPAGGGKPKKAGGC
jgi:hypothetical protein